MGDERQGPSGRHRRILLTQRTGCGVAGVGEDLEGGAPGRLTFEVLVATGLIESGESLDGEVDLAAHLQHSGMGLPRQHQRYRVNGAHVTRDVLADGAVPASGGAGEYTALIGQGHGQAVDLDLGGHGQLGVAHADLRGSVSGPLLDLLQAEDVLQGVHALVVGSFSEISGGASTDAARGRRGQSQSGMRGLERLQLPVEGVVLGVGPGALGVNGVVVRIARALDVAYEHGPASTGRGGNGGEIGSVIGRRSGGGIGHGHIFAHPPSRPGRAFSQRTTQATRVRVERSTAIQASAGRGRRRRPAAAPPSHSSGSSQAPTASSGRTTGSRG